MKIVTYLYYFLRSVLLRGFFNTIKLLKAEHSEEKRYGILSSLIKRSNSNHYYHYQGASYLVLAKIFNELKLDRKAIDFIDIGSGKGRVLFVAESFGFNNLIGIELDAALIKEAQNNLVRYSLKRKDSNISFVNANAIQYDYGSQSTLYFLFNPFSAEVLEKVLTRIMGSCGEETWFIYMNPLYYNVFEQKKCSLIKTFKTRFYTEALLYKVNFQNKIK